MVTVKFDGMLGAGAETATAMGRNMRPIDEERQADDKRLAQVAKDESWCFRVGGARARGGYGPA